MRGLAAEPRADRPDLGIVMMLGAYLLFAVTDTSVKWLAVGGYAAFQLAFMRYAGHFVISLLAIGRGGWSRERFATDAPALVLARAVLLVLSTVFNFVALRYLPLTVTSAIMFSAPVIVSALSMPLLGERVGPWRAAAICLGFAGVLIVMRPFGADFHWAALLSLFNAFAMALYSILTRKLSGRVSASTMQFYMGAFGTAVLLPPAVFSWVPPAGGLDWALLIGLGLWGWGGHELLTRAHRFAPASTLMPFTYSFMIYLTIASYVVFDHLPDGATLLGAAVIVASGLTIWWRERRRASP